jgi:hypothetical protein
MGITLLSVRFSETGTLLVGSSFFLPHVVRVEQAEGPLEGIVHDCPVESDSKLRVSEKSVAEKSMFNPSGDANVAVCHEAY